MNDAGDLGCLLIRVESVYDARDDAETGSTAQVVPRRLSPELGEADERLLSAVLETLRRVAASAERASTLRAPPVSALQAALGGAELVMRAELLAGRRAVVPGMIPSFAYIATVPFLDRSEALRRSEEVRKIVESEEWQIDR